MKDNLIHAWIEAKSKGDHALVCYIGYLLKYSEEGKKQTERLAKMREPIYKLAREVYGTDDVTIL